ncbi:hypothetical protein PIB30_055988 [Stylosanthes scabra]|uniref:Uncharacterized protein n=1 Tax=Stylosanthes scabra TaxID=79078 RepID=A0ABU6WL83_9FABA|nr:hypothetical protein [Stylosanthes scabra]
MASPLPPHQAAVNGVNPSHNPRRCFPCIATTDFATTKTRRCCCYGCRSVKHTWKGGRASPLLPSRGCCYMLRCCVSGLVITEFPAAACG